MSRTLTNSFAAFAAVFLAITSIGTIVAVPPAQAQATHSMTAPIEMA